MIGGCKVNMKIILFWSQLWVWKYWDNIFLFNCLRIWNSIVTILGYPFPCGRYHFTNIFLEGRQKQGFIFLQFGGEGSQIDMLPSKYIKVNYFLPKSAKKCFCVWRVSKILKKKLKKFWKKFRIFFFTKPILSIIYELC